MSRGFLASMLLLLLAASSSECCCGQTGSAYCVEDTDSESTTSMPSTDSESITGPIVVPCDDPEIETLTNGEPLFDECPAEPPEGSCKDGWCRIEPGTFVRGSPWDQSCRGKYSEKQVQVTLTRPFLMQQHEVTQKQWEAMGFPNPSRDVHPRKPVTWINWFEAAAYSNALSKAEELETCYDLSGCEGVVGSGCPEEGWFYQHGCVFLQDTEPPEFVPGLFYCLGDVHRYENWYECPGYRLPTLAEWEYAARACTSTATYNGDNTTTTSGGTCDVDEAVEPIAWYCGNSEGELREICTKKPNAWRLYDMLGNAMEYIDYQHTGGSLEYGEGEDGPLTDPMGSKSFHEQGISKMSSPGGSYRDDACLTRAAWVFPKSFPGRADYDGFRPVRTLFE